jgi:hypothetical protein
MEEVTCKVVLDTADPNDEHFLGYLDGAGIKLKSLSESGNYVSVEYVGTRCALSKMIERHFKTNASGEDRAMLESIVPVGSTMDPRDRARLIELMQEQSGDMHRDEEHEDLIKMLMEYELNGVRGLSDEPDEALLGEAASDYVDDKGKVVGLVGDFDPVNDEVFRTWAKYVHPELLCATCHGSGEGGGVDFDGKTKLLDCPTCKGSGLSGLALLPKYTVVRNRQVGEYVEVRATSPQEAAEKAKASSNWTGQADEQLTLEVWSSEEEKGDDLLYQE